MTYVSNSNSSNTSIEDYDGLFVNPVPEDLTCSICSLVLKQPLQLICGHRYCASCFERLKEYAAHLNTELVCPIDRKRIDLATVFPDNAVARTVRNLEVKCRRFESGCVWRGCLSDVEEHEEKCKYKRNEVSRGGSDKGLEVLVGELVHRVGKCEEEMSGKEKEIAHLKLAVKELTEKSSKNSAEISTLKKANGDMGREISMLKNVNGDMGREISALKRNNIKDESSKNSQDIVTLKPKMVKAEREISTLRNTVDVNLKKCTENNDRISKKKSEVVDGRSHRNRNNSNKTNMNHSSSTSFTPFEYTDACADPYINKPRYVGGRGAVVKQSVKVAPKQPKTTSSLKKVASTPKVKEDKGTKVVVKDVVTSDSNAVSSPSVADWGEEESYWLNQLACDDSGWPQQVDGECWEQPNWDLDDSGLHLDADWGTNDLDYENLCSKDVDFGGNYSD